MTNADYEPAAGPATPDHQEHRRSDGPARLEPGSSGSLSVRFQSPSYFSLGRKIRWAREKSRTPHCGCLFAGSDKRTTQQSKRTHESGCYKYWLNLAGGSISVYASTISVRTFSNCSTRTAFSAAVPMETLRQPVQPSSLPLNLTTIFFSVANVR